MGSHEMFGDDFLFGDEPPREADLLKRNSAVRGEGSRRQHSAVLPAPLTS